QPDAGIRVVHVTGVQTCALPISLETLLATFGLSLVLQQAVRTLFSPLNRSVTSPEWISGTLSINPVLSITYTRLYILLFGLAVFFALMLVMKRTALGLDRKSVV